MHFYTDESELELKQKPHKREAVLVVDPRAAIVSGLRFYYPPAVRHGFRSGPQEMLIFIIYI